MSEKTELEKEFERIKAEAIEANPDKATIIKLASSVQELYDALHAEEGGTSQQNDDKPQSKDLGTVTHKHVKDWEKGEGSNLDGGEDLSRTGGKISLTPDQMGNPTSYDPTEFSKSGSGKQIVANIMDEIDRLEFLQATKGLKPQEAKRYKVLRAKEENLLHSMWTGFRSRGGIGGRGSFWQCPVCGESVINSNKCPTCSYLEGTKIDQNEKRRWTILKGEQ